MTQGSSHSSSDRHSEFDAMVAAARQGDGAAFDALFRPLRPYVARYLGAMNPDASPELLESVRASAARRIRGFEGGADDFRTMVFTLAYVAAGNERGLRVEPAAFPPAQADGVEGGDDASAPDALRRLVAPLTFIQANVILLSVVGNLSVADIAKVMSLSELSVRAAQQRALRRAARDASLIRSTTLVAH